MLLAGHEGGNPPLDGSSFQDQVVYVTLFPEHKPSCEAGGVIYCFRSAKWFLEDQDGEG